MANSMLGPGPQLPPPPQEPNVLQTDSANCRVEQVRQAHRVPRCLVNSTSTLDGLRQQRLRIPAALVGA